MQDRSSTAGQASSTGPQPSRPSVIPPPSKSKGWKSGANVRRMRRIIAEDPEWSLAIVPLLTELCIQHIVENFQSESVLALGRRFQKARSRVGWVGTACPEAKPQRLGLGAAPALLHWVLIPSKHCPYPLEPEWFLPLSLLPGSTRFPSTLCTACLCPLLIFPTLSSKTQPKPYLPNTSSRKPSLVDHPPLSWSLPQCI